jgi:hypothetical protein
MNHPIEAYLNNQPMLKLTLTDIRQKKQIQANFHGEGDFFMVEFVGVNERVCGGCGAKSSHCGTWGVCDWENFRADSMEDLREVIDEMCERLEADFEELQHAAKNLNSGLGTHLPGCFNI